MRASAVLAVVAVALLAGSAQAWWCTGHMTIAQIAKVTIDSTVRDKVESIVQELSQMGPFPKNPDMVQVACWADDIKDNNFAMAGWHFLNMPYDPTNFPINTNPAARMTVDKALPIMEKAVKKYPNEWELTFALANLIHFMGDIHQPLHVTELFSSVFPTGDRGGNLFNVTVNNTATELHAVWDSICWQYTTDPQRPMSGSSYQFIEDLANTYINAYTFSQAQINEWNATQFAAESYAFAVAYSYANNTIQPFVTLDQSYISTCEYYAGMRIALAGARLASELTYLFGRGDRKTTAKEIYARMEEIRTGVNNVALEKHAALKLAQKKNLKTQ
jgi:hypothetical protein